MRSTIRVLALMTLTAAATAATAAAQNPPAGGPPPMGGPRANAGAALGARGAQMLLARSAELDLTDAQVTKLAGIARRAEARHRTMRAAMDSGRARFTQPGDSLARRQFAQTMQADMAAGMDKERDQAHVDLRDALAVLTADQQAKAWEMNAARGARAGAMRGGRGAGGMPHGGMARGGMARGGMPGQSNQMRPRRPARPPFDEFTGERNPR